MVLPRLRGCDAAAFVPEVTTRQNLDRRLEGREYVVDDDYSIADIAIWPWVSRFEWHQVDIREFANVRRWYECIANRPAVQRGYQVPTYTAPVPMPVGSV